MDVNTSDVEKRIARYWFSDGLAELSGGGMLLLIGLYFAAQEWLPAGSVRAILEASLALLLIGGALATRKLINALKLRLTYPRTGYVEYRTSREKAGLRRWAPAAIAFAVAAMLVVVQSRVTAFDWITAFTGLVFGLVFVLLRARASGSSRFYLLGALSLVLGLVLSVAHLPQGYGLGLLYGLVGLASMISGGVVLWRYLRDNPLPPQD